MTIRLFSVPRLAAVLVTSIVFTAPAVAERLVLDPVTAIPSRYERQLSTTPASVTVLTGEDLAPLATLAVEDILAMRAGVSLARSGGPGQQVSVFLRGTDSDSVLVLVDGVKFNGGIFGGANLQNLRGADIERIEVVRGPRSTLYGSEAIGGVIAITTHRGTDPVSGSVAQESGTGDNRDTLLLRAEGGSDNTALLHAGIARHHDDSTLALAIGQYRTGGSAITDQSDVTGEHRNTSATLHAAQGMGDARVGFDAWAARGRTQYLDDFTVMPLHQDFDTLVANAWAEAAINDRYALKTRFGIANDNLEQGEQNFLGDFDHASTHRQEAGVELQRHGGDAAHGRSNALVAGLAVERETADALVFGSPINEVSGNRALYLHGDASAGAQQVGIGVRNAVYDSFGEHWTADANYGLTLGDDTYGWLAWGSGFRAPDASERFGYGGNPALTPETTASTEAGLRTRFGAHEFTITGYLQKIDDLIDYPAPTYIATNIARARITGTELGWSRHTAASRIDVFVTLQDPVDETTGERLSRRPEKQLSATARHRTGAFEWRSALLAMDRRDNSAYDSRTLPGFAVLDLGVAWTARPGLVIDGRVENVADRDYALASGSAGDYRMPDRAAFIGVAWQR